MSRGIEGRTTPAVSLQFDRADRRYEPGDWIAARYRIDGLGEEPIEAIEAIEHSVLWYTEGKGEEDMGVHFFERVAAGRGATAADGAVAFRARLPASPLSYEGVIVKIRWCARVRIFFRTARDFVSEHVFEVGRLPPARMDALKSS
jgi:hypothetical protein